VLREFISQDEFGPTDVETNVELTTVGQLEPGQQSCAVDPLVPIGSSGCPFYDDVDTDHRPIIIPRQQTFLNDLARRGQPELWHDDALPGVVGMRGLSSEYAVDPVDEFIIGAVIGTDGYDLHRHGRVQRVLPGDLVVLDAEYAHRGTAIDYQPWNGCLLVLPAALWWTAVDEVPELFRYGISDPIVRLAGVRERFLTAHTASREGRDRLERECALLSLLDDISGTVPGQRRASGDPAVSAAVAVLRDVFPGSIDLETLAAEVGLPKFRLLRRFRREVGLTPHDFLASLRVSNARRLLAAGIPIAEAAHASGFADQSHLHRNFRARLGLTPGAYRNALA